MPYFDNVRHDYVIYDAGFGLDFVHVNSSLSGRIKGFYVGDILLNVKLIVLEVRKETQSVIFL